ncbi:hypothetical protein BGX26_002840 [Mortierella sp. AD094]|nr:hypothetical protein BGX26_002840 [Mortierella sp. AD094]
MLFLQSRSRRVALLAVLSSLLFATTPITADPIIDICSTNGCDTVSTFLEPCGGGATNSSLQQNFVYTVTPILGSCECNSAFFNAFSNCLACIKSQGQTSPEIDNQQNWVAQCSSYGFNFTAAPINFTAPTSGGNGTSGGGISKGAVAGIIIAVLLVAALAGGLFFVKNRRKRTKGSIFARPYSIAGTDAEDGGSIQPTFNAYSNYQNAAYPETAGYGDQDQQYYGYQDQDQHNYGSSQNDQDSDAMMMNNLRHNSYIPPPVPMSPAAVAAVGSSIGNLGSPRPSDAFPQNRPKNKDWEGRQYEYTSELISTDQLIHNDKAALEDEEELEPPRSRDRYVNDSDDFTSRRSLTPPRANMQSYRDEFTRPSFDREPRNSSERGSVSGINLIRGTGGYDSNEEDGVHESPESARRRRAAELFSAEGTRR